MSKKVEKKDGKPSEKFRLAKVSDLHEDPANARTHGERNRAAVRASLAEFGQVEALVVEKGTGRVIGGNCRLAELSAMGVKDVWVHEVDVHGVDATRLSLALNRTAELAAWDGAGLAAILAEIEIPENLGWSAEDLEKMLAATAGPAAPAEFPAVDETIKTEHACPRCGYRWSGGEVVEKEVAAEEAE